MRVYIAGPEVFLPNAAEVLATKKALCTEYNYEGVTPFDANIGTLENTYKCGVLIAQENEKLIDSCQVVIANITPFRGLSADPGTIFEVGYARAKGLRVLGYSYILDTHAKRAAQHYLHDVVRDGDFYRSGTDRTLIDDFEMADNAMIEGGIVLSGGSIVMMAPNREKYPGVIDDLQGFEACLKVL